MALWGDDRPSGRATRSAERMFAGYSLEQAEQRRVHYAGHTKSELVAELVARDEEAAVQSLAVGRALEPKDGDGDPATWRDWWDCTMSLLQGSPLACVVGGIALACIVVGFPVVWAAVTAAVGGLGR